MKTFVILLVIILSMMVSIGWCSPAAFVEAPDSLETFLLALLGSVVVGAAVSFIFEKLPYVDEWFANLDSKTKRLAVLIACFTVPILALSIGVWRGYFTLSDDMIFKALVAGFEAFTISQLAHLVVLKKPF